MKYLIFGGSGFIGSALKTYLQDRGEEVLTISRSGKNDGLAIDITRPSEFENIEFIPDVIVNCASRLPQGGINSTDPTFVNELFSTNVLGGVNICKWAVEQRVSNLLNLSTLAVVNKPWPNPLQETSVQLPTGQHTAYGMSKLSQEQMMNEAVHNTGTKVIHLRLASIYGDSMEPSGVLFFILNRLQKNETVTLTNANKVKFDFMHVKDVCKSILYLSKEKITHPIINTASGNSISLMEVASMLKEITGSSAEIHNTDETTETSEATIQVDLLKHYLGKENDTFIPLREGLTTLVKNNTI
ncbi:NAD-dependent epimerase/dehydratase family protein [Candidatus Ulvibacter alkanivorans]|uniref:NAD-dependent epimerase/dehydratase family protein n=1 Tax=Candidatus Ulvibacter alkanivorans TaxID=2267620 RepID=UPI000DF4BD37|nr:NAD(P)-dependent oxidoreductase [Candidatus Ulvibacter alkanivorans]